MSKPQDSPFMQPRRGDFITEARIGLREPPAMPKETYLGSYALVGILGGITAALLWLMVKAGYQP